MVKRVAFLSGALEFCTSSFLQAVCGGGVGGGATTQTHMFFFSCVSKSRNITTAPSIPIHATKKNSFRQSFITSKLFLNTAPPAFFRRCWAEVQKLYRHKIFFLFQVCFCFACESENLTPAVYLRECQLFRPALRHQCYT